MAPISRKRSFADHLQHAEGATNVTKPPEYDDEDFENEVLQLPDGVTEAAFDEGLNEKAHDLGISRSQTPTPAHNSVCETDITVESNHARTGSTGSQQSNLTATSIGTLPHHQFETGSSTPMRKRASYRRSLSFSEYEKYLIRTDGHQSKNLGFLVPPMAAPSLFSVSSRRSYHSIRNGFKTRFRLRRTKRASSDDLR